MRKLFAFLLAFAFLHCQTMARASQGQLDSSFAQMATEISQGKLSDAEIIEKSKSIVSDARASGITEQEFIAHLSKKLSLNMSDEDIQKTVEDLRADHSPAKITQIAESLKANQSGDKVLMVLLTFVLLSALWIGVFFLLADIFVPHR